MSPAETPGLPFDEPEEAPGRAPSSDAGPDASHAQAAPQPRSARPPRERPPYLRSRAERKSAADAALPTFLAPTPEADVAAELESADSTGADANARAVAAAASGERRTRPEADSEDAPLTVSELTQRIQGSLRHLGRVAVEGEVSRITRAHSGHVYFDLKDAGAKIACVVWRSQVQRGIRFELAEGAQVAAHGTLDVYAPRGGYSIVVERLEPAGIGALLVRFEELKRELGERGWFDRALPLPRLPRRIGVVTSRDGAAFRDFLRTRSLRWPGYPVRLAHAPVQGPTAAAEIARALDALDQSGVDVIVLCRGGGSLEDLWSFNELLVAEAIRRTSVPVVCGVGHETDVTLADFVSDHRAHTPTDAAQCVIPDRALLLGRLERAANHLFGALDGQLARRGERLERLARARVLRDPAALLELRERELRGLGRGLGVAADGALERAAHRLGALHRRLDARSPGAQLAQRALRLELAAGALGERGRRPLERRAERLRLATARLEAISPLRVLARGWSLTTRPGELAPLRRAADVSPGDLVETRLAEGVLIARVEDVRPDAGAPFTPESR